MRFLVIVLFLPLLNAKNNYHYDEPIVLKQVYHFPNKYEKESYNYWQENIPQPHQHGIEPGDGKLHQHYAKYNDNENFDGFITGDYYK